MGIAWLVASCVACHTAFTCNPHKVPSLRLRGFREPLCKPCAERWIKLHPDAGFVIAPDAYEPIDEREL